MRNFLLKALAVAVIYLMISLPTSFALTIVNIIPQNYGTAYSPVLKDLAGVSVGIEERGFQNWDIVLNVSEKTSSTLNTIYLYTCKDQNPSDCVAQPGASYAAGQEIRLDWRSEVADSQGQAGNILLAVKVNNPGGVTWETEWLEFINSGQPQHTNPTNDIPAIDMEVRDFASAASAKTFIEDNNVLPFRSDWVNWIRFSGATALHELASAPPNQGQSSPGDTVSTPPLEYSTILAESGGIKNGITLYNNPTGFVCGDSNCELGENCCLDCGCFSNQYCDIGNFCASPPYIVSTEPTSTYVSNCNQQNTVTVTVRMYNRPSDMSIVSQTYTLNGTDTYTSYACHETSQDIFTCDIAVPPPQVCNSGSFILEDNSITFGIAYTDQGVQTSESLTATFPDITIGSWTCGNGLEETSLGESYLNCCYDAPCPSGQHCDYQTGYLPETGSCASSPTNLNIYNFTPPSSYNPSGSTFQFEAQILNAPASLSVGTETCSLGCTTGLDSCQASCSLSCSPRQATPDYISSCTMSFSITDYNQSAGYLLVPNITFPVTYNDGPRTVSDSLTANPAPFSFGSQFCGNLICDFGETSSNCCYDCGCDLGEYCSTVTTANPSSGDSCSLTNMRLLIDSVNPGVINDQKLDHAMKVRGRLMNPPPSGLINRRESCSIWQGTIGCTAYCDEDGIAGGGEMPINCTLYFSTPTVEGETSYVMEDNRLQLSFEYNNGSLRASEFLEGDLGDITVNQISHCGLDGCESWLGEDSGNCCIDCPCSGNPAYSGYICIPGGANPNSTCMQTDQIIASMINISPDPLECNVIPSTGYGGCSFPEHVIDFEFRVDNAPSSIRLVSAQGRFDGGDFEYIECFQPDIVNNASTIVCKFYMDDIPDPGGCQSEFSCIQGGTEEHSIDFALGITYDNGGFMVEQQLDASTTFDIFKDTKNLLSCEIKKQTLRHTLNNYKRNQDRLMNVIYLIWGLVVLDLTRCIICNTVIGGSQCTPIFFLLGSPESCSEALEMNSIVASCLTFTLLGAYRNYESSIPSTEAKLSSVCSASSTSDMVPAMEGMNFDMTQMLQIGTGLYCAFTLGKFTNFAAGGGEEPPVEQSFWSKAWNKLKAAFSGGDSAE